MSKYRFISQDQKTRDDLAARLTAKGAKVTTDEAVRFHVEDEDGQLLEVKEDEPDEKGYADLNAARKVAYGVTWYVLDSDVMP